MKTTCVMCDLQVWLYRQRRIAKLHSFGIFNLRSLGYIVSIKLCRLTLIIYKRDEIDLDRLLNGFRGEVYSIQHHVIKFVSDLRQVGGFLHQ